MDEVIKDSTQVEQPVITDETVFAIPEFGDVSLADLKAWKNGHMMQSDYTKKTQELAKQKEELLSSSKKNSGMSDMEIKMQRMEIQMELNKLKSAHSDFDEVAVLDKAIELTNKGVSADAIDFDMLYKATRPALDEEALRAKILQELHASADTSSLVGNGSSNPPATQTITLTPDEDRIRMRMNMTVEDWVKYR